MRLIGALRSLLGISGCLLLLGVAAPLSLYLIILPWIALRPAHAKRIGADWVSFLAHALVFSLCTRILVFYQ